MFIYVSNIVPIEEEECVTKEILLSLDILIDNMHFKSLSWNL